MPAKSEYSYILQKMILIKESHLDPTEQLLSCRQALMRTGLVTKDSEGKRELMAALRKEMQWWSKQISKKAIKG